jgi:hypothetical protein
MVTLKILPYTKVTLTFNFDFELDHPVPEWYKYGDLALQVGGVSNKIVKYGHEFCGTLTQAWLLWQGPGAIVQVNYRPILSHQKGCPTSRNSQSSDRKRIWSWAPDGSPTPRQASRLTVGRKLTSTSTRNVWRQVRILIP